MVRLINISHQVAILERPCFKALSRKCIILQPFSLNLLLFTVKLIEEALSSVFVDGDICNKTVILRKYFTFNLLLPVLDLTFTYINLSLLVLLKCCSNISRLSGFIITNTAGKCPDIPENPAIVLLPQLENHLEISGFVGTNMAGKCLDVSSNIPSPVGTNTAGKCHNVSLDTSSGFILTKIETPPWTSASCLAAVLLSCNSATVPSTS